MESLNRKNVVLLIIVFLFGVTSAVCCFPERNGKMKTVGINSSRLTRIVSLEDNIRREEYVDEAGKLSMAADKHYAAVVKKLDANGNIISEYYFDNDNEPIMLSSGQCGVIREYDSSGNEVKMTYVDAEGAPIWTTSGYVSILKTYDESGNEIGNYYTDAEMNPVCRVEGYAGRIKDYDENGNCIQLTNIDLNGNPVNSTLGYATEKRSFNPDKQVSSVMYYDAKGEPTTSTLNQYGEAYEYDELGRRNKITYLDQNGNAVLNSDGYAVVLRTFKEDNSVETEMYFNTEEQPIKLSHGQYGIRRKNGSTVYLDKQGQQMILLSLDNIVHDNYGLVLFGGILLCVFPLFLPRTFKLSVMIFYIVFIIYMTLMFRKSGESIAETEVFWSYEGFFSNRSVRVEIFQNIWLFVPFGALLNYISKKRWMLVAPIALTIAIEMAQFYTGRGLFEFDDIINNILGGYIGYGIGELLSEIKHSDSRDRIASLYAKIIN